MVSTDRFIAHELQRHGYLQPECPAYVHCTRQSEEPRSGARFLQLRLVNRGEDTIETVVFDLEGLDACGEVCYIRQGLVMAKCLARPGEIFGEERLFTLERRKAAAFRITVERVVFSGGMIWRRLPHHRLTTIQEAGWKLCDCGMPNPEESKSCLLCGKELALREDEETPETEALFPQIRISATPERPAPILRRELPHREMPFQTEEGDEDEEDEEEGVPGWLAVLLCVFGSLAILAVLAFVAFCLYRYMM